MKLLLNKKTRTGIILIIAIALSGFVSSYFYFSSKINTKPEDKFNNIADNEADNTLQKGATLGHNDDSTNDNKSIGQTKNDNLIPDKNNQENSNNNNNTGTTSIGNPTSPDGKNKDNNIDNDGNKDINNNSKDDNIYGPKIKKPDAVKAIYLTGWSAGDTGRLNSLLTIAHQTEINSFVVDIKDDDGYVSYASDIPAVKEYDAYKQKYNIDKLITTLHDNGIYVIGRLVCFKDPVLSSKRPDLAVKDVSGGLWKDNHKITWLDPYNKESWPYIIDIAKEALSKGFDEIQFDYVRFPNDGNKSAMVFKANDKKKYEVINEFLAYAKSELPGAIISADVFGIICESPEDTEDIGQYLELIGKDIDYISPMVYPSHYALGQIVNKITFPKPDLDPYGVVYNSLVKAKNRIAAVEGYKADVRPYLQGFTASWLRSGNYQVYGPKQIREQIQAVYDAGYKEWIIWDPANKYPIEAFEKE
ncbi:MAG TPA: putative glycoside hydrolase [Clostridiaceae bacterium]|nr:putative glycoside hydrolase [Clostridiaceae bacterium]